MKDNIILGTDIKLNKRVVNGRIVSKKWQVTAPSKVGKKPLRKSTGTANRKEAAKIANQLAIEFWDNEAAGLPTTSRRFNKVAELFISQMERDVQNGLGKDQYEENIRILRNNFIPFFSTNLIGSIDIADLNAYVVRRREQRDGEEISRSYQSNENTAWNGLMKFAYEHKWLAAKLTLPKVKTKEPSNRTRFTDAEWRKIRIELERRRKLHSKNKTTVKIRQFIYDYSLFLRNTGIRCGRECLSIKWNQCEFVRTDELLRPHRQLVTGSNQVEVLRVHLRQGETKTGKKRSVIVRNEQQSVSHALIKLAERNEDTKKLIEGMPQSTVEEKNAILRKLFESDEYVFRYADDGSVIERSDEEQVARLNRMSCQLTKEFTRVLKEQGLKVTKDGSVHTLYSLRHTYASKMLELGCSIEIVAKQLGNSVPVTDNFYNAADVTSNAPMLSGILAAKEFESSKTSGDLVDKFAQMSVGDLTNVMAEISAALQLKAG